MPVILRHTVIRDGIQGTPLSTGESSMTPRTSHSEIPRLPGSFEPPKRIRPVFGPFRLAQGAITPWANSRSLVWTKFTSANRLNNWAVFLAKPR